MIDRLVSHYKLVERIGGGAMSEVFRAEDLRLGRAVALKFLPADLTPDEAARDRFLLEARAASALDHPNICTVHDIASHEGRMFLVMAYCRGETLASRLLRGPLPVGEAVEVAAQVADGLGRAHQQGIVHRDIKPANLILVDDGLVKILDFGIAKLVGTRAVTREGTTVGTAAYMSPEQARGDDVDPRSDLWSLGVVLSEAITGHNPFQRDKEVATLAAIIDSEPPPLAPHLPPEWRQLEAVVGRLLTKAREHRTQTAQELLAELRSLQGRPLAATRTFAAPRPAAGPSIAVLPFTDLSRERDQEYFCHGVAEELLDALTKIRGLHVASRTSAQHFASHGADVREIGRRLRVGTVLEGSVRKEGRRLRVTVQLVNAESGYHLWSGKFDREMEDVFAIQEEIARTVAHTLALTVMGGSSGTLVRREPRNLDAYNLYLKGRYHWNKRTEDALGKAIVDFRAAIDEDPTYARAHSGLADCHLLLGIYGARPPGEAMPAARDAAHRALELDSTLAEATAAEATVAAVYDWDFPRAEGLFRHALELDSDCANAHHWLAVHALLPLGRHEEALVEIRRALALEPLSLAINTSLGLPSEFAGCHDDAEKAYRNALEIDPGFALAHLFLGRVHLARERFREAIEEMGHAVELSGGSAETVAALASAHGLADQLPEARDLFAQLRERARRRYVSPVLLAEVFAGLGQRNDALAQLEKAAALRASDLLWMRVRPAFVSLRSEPRFAALLAAVQSGGGAAAGDAGRAAEGAADETWTSGREGTEAGDTVIH